MNRTLAVRSEAATDIEEAYIWYERRRRGLGADFLLCLEEVFGRLLRDPGLYPVVYRDVRRALVRRFPYGVFYLVEESRVVVLAVFHSSRDPKEWQSRA